MPVFSVLLDAHTREVLQELPSDTPEEPVSSFTNNCLGVRSLVTVVCLLDDSASEIYILTDVKLIRERLSVALETEESQDPIEPKGELVKMLSPGESYEIPMFIVPWGTQELKEIIMKITHRRVE